MHRPTSQIISLVLTTVILVDSGLSGFGWANEIVRTNACTRFSCQTSFQEEALNFRPLSRPLHKRPFNFGNQWRQYSTSQLTAKERKEGQLLTTLVSAVCGVLLWALAVQRFIGTTRLDHGVLSYFPLLGGVLGILIGRYVAEPIAEAIHEARHVNEAERLGYENVRVVLIEKSDGIHKIVMGVDPNRRYLGSHEIRNAQIAAAGPRGSLFTALVSSGTLLLGILLTLLARPGHLAVVQISSMITYFTVMTYLTGLATASLRFTWVDPPQTLAFDYTLDDAQPGYYHVVLYPTRYQPNAIADVSLALKQQQIRFIARSYPPSGKTPYRIELTIPRSETFTRANIERFLRDVELPRTARAAAMAGKDYTLSIDVNPQTEDLAALFNGLQQQDLGLAIHAVRWLPPERTSGAVRCEVTVTAPRFMKARDIEQAAQRFRREQPGRLFEIFPRSLSNSTLNAANAILRDYCTHLRSLHPDWDFNPSLDELKTWQPLEDDGQPVDNVFIENFQRALHFALKMHGDPDDPTPEEKRAIAVQKRQSTGNPYYIVHLLGVTFDLINGSRVRDPSFILASLLHDVLEDVPKNMWDGFRRAVLPLVPFSRTGRGRRLIFPQLPNEFRGFVAAQEEALKKAAGEADIDALEPAFIAWADKKLRRDLRLFFPSYSEKLIENIEMVSHLRGYYSDEIRSLRGEKGQTGLIAIKLMDRRNNSSDLERLDPTSPRRKIANTLRNILPLVNRRVPDRTEVYIESRRHFLDMFLPQAIRWGPLQPHYEPGERDDPSRKLEADRDMTHTILDFQKWARENSDWMSDTMRGDLKKFITMLEDLRLQIILDQMPTEQRSDPENSKLTALERHDGKRNGTRVGAVVGLSLYSLILWSHSFNTGTVPQMLGFIVGGVSSWAAGFVLGRLASRIAELIHEWLGHVWKAICMGYTHVRVIADGTGGLTVMGKVPGETEILPIIKPEVRQAGPLASGIAAWAGLALTGTLGLWLGRLIQNPNPQDLLHMGVAWGLVTFLGALTVVNLRFVFADSFPSPKKTNQYALKSA